MAALTEHREYFPRLMFGAVVALWVCLTVTAVLAALAGGRHRALDVLLLECAILGSVSFGSIGAGWLVARTARVVEERRVLFAVWCRTLHFAHLGWLVVPVGAAGVLVFGLIGRWVQVRAEVFLSVAATIAWIGWFFAAVAALPFWLSEWNARSAMVSVAGGRAEKLMAGLGLLVVLSSGLVGLVAGLGSQFMILDVFKAMSK